MKTILVTVRDEALLAIIGEVLTSVSAEMVSEAETILRQVLPGLVVDAISSS